MLFVTSIRVVFHSPMITLLLQFSSFHYYDTFTLPASALLYAKYHSIFFKTMHILMHIFEKCWMSTFEEQKSFWKRNSLIIRLKIETSISNLMLNIEFSRVVISSALAYRRTHCCNIAYADFISSSDQITSHKDSLFFFDSNNSSQNWPCGFFY